MSLAISLLWLLISVVVLCLVVYLILWVLKSFVGVAIPEKVETGIWLIVLLLVLIWVLTALAGGGFHPFRYAASLGHLTSL